MSYFMEDSEADNEENGVTTARTEDPKIERVAVKVTNRCRVRKFDEM